MHCTQGVKQDFTIHESQNVFEKLQTEVTNLLKNCKSTFFDD